MNAYAEYRVSRRFQGASLGEAAALLRFGRRIADVVVISAGFVLACTCSDSIRLPHSRGVDKAVKVGDFLKCGETSGTVDSIGLRSTRIRTLDRTIPSIPNGQISNAGIETISARDMFWLHHARSLVQNVSAVIQPSKTTSPIFLARTFTSRDPKTSIQSSGRA